MSIQIIGLAGLRRAGKNTTATVLQGSFAGPPFAFADGVKIQAKRLLKEVCGVDVDPWNDKSDAMRGVLQHLGTDVVRAYMSDAWVNYLMRQIDHVVKTYNTKLYNNTKCIYITDVRFPNEIKAIHDRNGSVIWVWCEEEVRLNRINWLDGPQAAERSTHASENSIRNGDCDAMVDSTNMGALDISINELKRIGFFGYV